MNPLVYFIPPKSKTVVEFGCGDGSLGAEFLQIQPECRFIGVDIDGVALSAAEKKLSAAVSGTLETVNLEANDISKVDCFLYHGRFLGSPGLKAMLQQHMKLLSEDGQMLFLVDHMGYIRNAVDLFRGAKPSMESALTMNELMETISASGMTVVNVQPIYSAADAQWKEDEATKTFVQAFSEFCRHNGLSGRNDIWARAFFVRAVRKTYESKMLVQSILGEALVTARIRINEPNRFCMTEPGFEARAQRGGVKLENAETYPNRILIRQRITMENFREGVEQIQRVTRNGYLLLYELDDSPSRWAENHAKTGYLDFVGSHAVQVSTSALADEVRQYNPEVKVFMNHLEYLPEPREYMEEPSAPVTVFFGALNREEDWTDIMPVINELAQKYGKRLRFRVLADQQFFAALQTEHKEFVGSKDYFDGRYVPYNVYIQTLRSADISLLPLHDTLFNRAKSDLKFIESAGHGAAVLASPTVYRDTVRDGETGFIYHSPGEFRDRFTLLIENQARRREMAHAAYEYVKHNRLLSQHYEERLEWYRELLARLPELNRSLEERLKALAERFNS
ncbi:MAG: glycosyltransferase [Selenomonadaceae bacterium]|nr:glycosyltransferase [Selenomonadaceae bacterium]